MTSAYVRVNNSLSLGIITSLRLVMPPNTKKRIITNIRKSGASIQCAQRESSGTGSAEPVPFQSSLANAAPFEALARSAAPSPLMMSESRVASDAVCAWLVESDVIVASVLDEPTDRALVLEVSAVDLQAPALADATECQ